MSASDVDKQSLSGWPMCEDQRTDEHRSPGSGMEGRSEHRAIERELAFKKRLTLKLGHEDKSWGALEGVKVHDSWRSTKNVGR